MNLFHKESRKTRVNHVVWRQTENINIENKLLFKGLFSAPCHLLVLDLPHKNSIWAECDVNCDPQQYKHQSTNSKTVGPYMIYRS